MNCKYCGLWNCTETSPICDEQRSGCYADHPCRAFKIGDWVEHPEYGVGQVVWVKPVEKGLRINYSTRPTEWYGVDDLKVINDTIFPAVDMNENPLKIGDEIYYPVGKGGAGNAPRIKRGIIKGIAGKASHRGYGYYTRHLKIKPNDGGRVFTHNYPANCIKI